MFPDISIESINLYKALEYVKSEKYEELSKYLSNALDNLISGGAEIVALTAGTMHVVYEDLKEKVNVPFINISETVSDIAVQYNYKKVGLLGTIFTMKKDFLKKPFIEKGIDVVIPSNEDMVVVNERISRELEYGIVKDSTREELIKIITEK